MNQGSASDVVYRALLFLYPRSFRRAVGTELAETFRDARRHAARRSRWSLIQLWLVTLVDLFRSVLAEWWPIRTPGPPRQTSQRKATLMDTFLQDVRYGLRTLVRSPGFTVTVLVTLALGIGANTAIFSLINEVLLRPLPVHEPEQLVRLYTSDFSSGVYGSSSHPDYVDFRENSTALDDIAAFSFPGPVNFGTGDVALRLTGQLVTGNYFNVLGINAVRGRVFGPADNISVGSHPVAVISHTVWQTHFGGDQDLVGQSVSLNGHPFTVIGITPASFTSIQVGTRTDVWVPLVMYPQLFPRFAQFPVLESRGGRWLHAVGRLRGGGGVPQAQAEVTAVMARLAQEFPNSNMGTLQDPDGPRPVTLVDAGSASVGARVRDTTVNRARLLMAIVGSVLLIACANVANLLLARANRRGRETALRVAVGASRMRIVRQLLTESVLLGFGGGAAGLVLAYVISRVLLPLGLPAALQGSLNVSSLALDFRVLGFAIVVSGLTGLLFGVFPAVTSSRPNLVPALKDEQGGGNALMRRRRYGLRDVLVVVQLAASLVLLVTAGLFVRSTIAAYKTELGFTVEGVALASMDLASQGLNQDQGVTFFRQLLDDVSALPGVQSAALAMVVPVSASGARTTVGPANYQPEDGEDMEINFNVVSDQYFESLEIPILRGRSFDRTDVADGTQVIIVNQTFAERFWPGETPIGKQVFGGGGDGQPFEVVGVALDGRYRAVREDPMPYMYFPLSQAHQDVMTLAVKALDPASVIPAVRSIVRSQQPNMPVYDGQLLKDHFGDALDQERSTATMISALGLLALALATVGVYGVVTYSVAQRAREFGVRTALGAGTGDVIRLVLGRGVRLAVSGVIVGMVTAVGLSSIVSRFILGVSPTDPLTMGIVVVTMVAVALLASFIPALRAARHDPISVLRSQ